MSEPAPSASPDFAASIRPHVQRVLSGEFGTIDLSNIFLFVRSRSYGRETVREVGDFVAHFGERDQRSFSTQMAKRFFRHMRAYISLLDQQSRKEPRISFDVDAVEANFEILGQSLIRERTGLKTGAARRVFAALMRKLTLVKSTHGEENLTKDESSLFNLLVGTVVVKPAFDEDRLFSEFQLVLEKNRLLYPTERAALERQKSTLALFVISRMHNCTLAMEPAYVAHLQGTCAGGHLAVTVRSATPTTTLPQGLYVATNLFSTSLKANDWCEQELLVDDQTKWDFPIELGPNKKLRKLV